MKTVAESLPKIPSAGLSFDELQIKYDLEARQAAQAKIEEFRFFLDRANDRVRKEKEELSSNRCDDPRCGYDCR